MSKKKQKPRHDAGGLLSDLKPPRQTLFGWLRGRFFAGVVIAAPIAISVGVVYWLITVIDSRVKPLLPPVLDPETYTNIAIPGVGVIVAIVGLTLLGAVATNLLGRSVLRLSDRILLRIPIVSNLYSVTKQMLDLIGSNDQATFKEVVLIEYPKQGTWCIGFLSARAKGEVLSRLGDKYVGVFVPTTPNPTSGFLMYVNENEIIRLKMSVEDGAKLIISGGLVVPEEAIPELTGEADPAPTLPETSEPRVAGTGPAQD